MPLTNPNKVVTEERLNEYHRTILPYLGGNSMVACGGGYAPIGTVISYMGTRAPSDFLICDGTVYNIADYTELADFFELQFGSSNFFGGDGNTTFAVPDLRGEFLRGTGTNSHANQGSGANVGVHQDATENNTVWSDEANSGIAGRISATTDPRTKQNPDSQIWYTNTGRFMSSYTWTPISAAAPDAAFYTSRPTNTSVLYCIKAKSQGNGYSLDEQIVGTWIDGKPIYQKTVQATTPSSSTNNWMTISSILGSNANIVDIPTCIIDWESDGRNGRNVSPTYFNATNNFYALTITQGCFAFNFEGTWFADRPIVFTVQYTKTTD